MPQTKFVVGKALKIGLRPIVGINKVDKPDARAARGGQRGVRPVRRPRRHRRAARLPDPLRLGQAGLDGRWHPKARRTGMAPLFDLVLAHVRRADGRGRSVPHARHDPGGQPVSRPHHHRPHLVGHDASSTMPVKVLARDGRVVEQGRVSKILAFRGIERSADRRGRRRRHRRHRRADQGQGRRHLLRPGGRGGAVRPSRSTRRRVR